MQIIDVSEFQKSIDWSKVKVDGAVIRMGIRGSIKGSEYYKKIRKDFYFDQNLAGVKKYGIRYSVYFFPTSITDEEAVEEAAWIIDHVKGLDLSFPVWLDSEMVDRGDGRADGLSPEKRTHLLRVICDHLEGAGIPCGVYASTSWLQGRLDMSKFQASVRNNTWVAQNPKLTYKGAACMWQYGTTSVPGVKGKCDINVTLTAFDMSARKNKEAAVAYYRSVIVDKARSFLGASQGSAKHKEIVNVYDAHKPLPRGYSVTYTDAWCATFVSAIAILCKYTAIIPVECSCPQMIVLAKKMNIWVENDAYKPKPGDIILYDWEDSGTGDNVGTADHIGYVETVNGNTITVIEGNMGNASKVGRRSIQVNGRYIRGYITPKYTADAPPKKAEAKKVDLAIKLPELHPGDTGEAVKLWQFLTGAEITGVLDEAQVRAWQKENGKTVDGWVGKGCWTKALKNKGWIA